MASYLIAMSSITYANKAREVLRTAGYKSSIEKTPKNLASGCGYSINVSGDIEHISALLAAKGIALRDVMKLGDADG